MDGVAAARGRGADQAEVYLWQAHEQIGQRAAHLRDLQQRHVSGASVRALRDGRLATVSTSGLAPEDIAWAADRATRASRLVPATPRFHGFAPARNASAAPSEVAGALIGPEPGRLLQLMERMTSACSGRDVDYFEGGVASRFGMFAVANSEGVAAWDQNAYEACSLEVRCRLGGAPRFVRGRLFARGALDDAHDVEAFGEQLLSTSRAAARAPRPLGHVMREAILDAEAAAPLLHFLAPSLAGRPAEEGRSRFAGRLGQPVATELLTLRDRPRDGRGCRNQRIDDEGIPTREETLLVERGVLRAYLYPWATAAEFDRDPTGHGLRPLNGRYAKVPSAMPANLEVDPGDWTLEEMIVAADAAVLVRGPLMGAFTINALSGDFSVVAPSAFEVKGGRVQGPVARAMLSGNIFDVMATLKAIGRPAQRIDDGTSVPLWIRGIACTT